MSAATVTGVKRMTGKFSWKTNLMLTSVMRRGGHCPVIKLSHQHLLLSFISCATLAQKTERKSIFLFRPGSDDWRLTGGVRVRRNATSRLQPLFCCGGCCAPKNLEAQISGR